MLSWSSTSTANAITIGASHIPVEVVGHIPLVELLRPEWADPAVSITALDTELFDVQKLDAFLRWPEAQSQSQGYLASVAVTAVAVGS
jgi:hypothetical protein